MAAMHTLRRLAFLKPVHHAQRHFTNPKALPQISLRVPARQPGPITSTPSSISDAESAENVSEDFVEVPEVEDVEDCALSNPYYATLLASKLDACPPQPFNEATNIVWGAVYDTVQRGHRVDLMSRWEQIQRGVIRPSDVPTPENDSERRRHRERGALDPMQRGFVDTVCNVNDLLQTHQSLDDVVRDSKAQRSRLIAKATGSLHGIIDSARTTQAQAQQAQAQVQSEEKEKETLQMRNDLKWRIRKMKLHRKKKRREGLRLKKATMQKRNQQ